MNYTKLSTIASLACCLGSMFWPSTLLAQQSVPAPSAESPTKESKISDVIQIFGNKHALETATGSGFVLNESALEQFEFDDIHRVLQGVHGVYIREEDGYGLRPNIGLRGATSERSSKIALLEDGVLIAPAPYSAPAAYYFPNISRMTQVEVFKGPSAITYGPNTVGGAINMLSRTIHAKDSGELDVAIGQQNYAKTHGHYSKHIGNLGLMLEGIHLRADGFKSLANDDNTGFAKNEILGKINYEFADDPFNQQIQIKVGYSEEVSHETYLGLTDTDFSDEPYQRYAASQNDKFDWEHLQLQASHYIELSPEMAILTQVYRRDFNRDWDRLNGFDSNRSLDSILSSPETGLNARFMQILKGEEDSLTSDETLIFTLNDRTFYSQGIQSKLTWDSTVGEADMTIDAGLRIHQDQVERHHRARYLNMVNAQLTYAGKTDDVITSNKDTTTAIAAFVNSKIQWGDLHTSFGLRIESIDGESANHLAQSLQKNSDTIILPGAGLFYQITPELGVLAGVNKGFVPNSPGEESDIKPEESWNYELGLRANIADWQVEAIGFYNDYSNLKGSCTFSSGCITELDVEFNGGEVDIYGVEFSANGQFSLPNGFQLPVKMAYTHSQSEFQTSFASTFSQWGNVTAGDELPYLPENQFTLQLGLAGEKWQVDLAFKYITEMSEASGTGVELEGVVTSDISQIDIAAWYQLNNALRLYSKLDNLTDQVNIVSRRPFGARPGKPRQFVIGAKYAF
ncbi:TonB-dependent receptor [Paraglaciecola aquimarina]|uniref:TonB-dependent receptor n=1 Tax=Paraglaciecola aquimarina TaxID=1235557 RepID=A0ABU3SVH4_9ALTE|nr:TonB-dependent receptor [Paraglaciecola aquimarina]MDU0354016.1 TonB-dependent receptor [Paraglaciecola aquimarina]